MSTIYSDCKHQTKKGVDIDKTSSIIFLSVDSVIDNILDTQAMINSRS